MTSAHATHPGLIRQNNEDSLRTDDNQGIYLLADGIGGHNAGEVASALAVETVYTALSLCIANGSSDDLFDLMAHALRTAHAEIAVKARSSLSFMGMGTTLVVAVMRENMVYIAHAGDSRAYLLKSPFRKDPNIGPKGDLGGGALDLTKQIPPGPPLQSGETGFSPPPNLPFMPQRVLERGGTNFKRLTNDHTMGDQLLANGVPREQIQEKQFHNLTQAIGCGAPPLPDFSTVEFGRGDLLLLCSDGLTDMLADSEIEAILTNGDADLDTLAGNLVAAANANGGRDNVSVVLVKSP
jgi:protein phosphatase